VSLVTETVAMDSVPVARVSTSVDRAVSVTAAVRAAPVAPTPMPMNFGGLRVVVVWRRSATVRRPWSVTTDAAPKGI
jgi:hypothetical protein